MKEMMQPPALCMKIDTELKNYPSSLMIHKLKGERERLQVIQIDMRNSNIYSDMKNAFPFDRQ